MMLTRKRKLILQLLEITGEISRLRFVKLMFLISREHPSYDFIPYNYGPFSFELYKDVNWLIEKGFAGESKENIFLINQLQDLNEDLDHFILKNKVEEKLHLSDKDLIDDIYDQYPWYTIFSKYRKKMEYERNETGILSIGYEGRSVDEFFNELLKNKVQVLVDVRKNPFSRKFGFSKKKLIDYGERLGIEYVHYPDLGIEGMHRKELETYDDYQRLFERYRMDLDNKMDLVDEIIGFGEKKRIALFCFERDPGYCHRNVIAEIIKDQDLEVKDL